MSEDKKVQTMETIENKYMAQFGRLQNGPASCWTAPRNIT